jgi:hypothetical protein
MTDEPGSPLARMRCCVCGADDMDHAVDYVEMTLRSDLSSADQGSACTRPAFRRP